MAAQRPAPARPARAAQPASWGAAPAARGILADVQATTQWALSASARTAALGWPTPFNTCCNASSNYARQSILNQCGGPYPARPGAGCGANRIVCEDIAAPEEQAEVGALRAAGLQTHIATFARTEENFQLGRVIPNEVREAASGKVAPSGRPSK
jgi:hypothetical protein